MARARAHAWLGLRWREGVAGAALYARERARGRRGREVSRTRSAAVHLWEQWADPRMLLLLQWADPRVVLPLLMPLLPRQPPLQPTSVASS